MRTQKCICQFNGCTCGYGRYLTSVPVATVVICCVVAVTQRFLMSVTVTTVIKIPEHFRAIKLVSTLTFPIIPYHHLPSWYVRLCKGIMSAIVNIYASKSKHPRMFKTAINHRLNAKKGCTQTVKKGCILFAFLYAYFFNLYAYFFGLFQG